MPRSADIPAYEAFKAEGARIKERAKLATAPDAPEPITDPVTGEQRLPPLAEPEWTVPAAPAPAPAPADEKPVLEPAQATEWEDVGWTVPAAPASPAALVEAAAAEAVKAMKAAEAANQEITQPAARAEAAHRAEAEAAHRTEVERRAPLIAAAIAEAERQADAELEQAAAESVVGALRLAVARGQVGRLTVGDGQLASTIAQLVGSGMFARPGHPASAGVLTIDREGGGLGVRVDSPGMHARYERSAFGSLDDPAALKWARSFVADIRETPRTAVVPVLLLVAESCVPASLEGLSKLADEFTVGVALVSDGEPGWTVCHG